MADNGIGIPREAQASVFERFYRVDKSRSKATGGTGLGLAIVKHIARIHNARIKLESQVDVGTTITVTFPTAFLIQHEMHVCPPLRAGVFCWVKACAAAAPQRCPGLQVQHIHALLPAALQKCGALRRKLLPLRLRGQWAVGSALTVQPHKHLRLLQGD